jgi:effector-binding domain-containing protein
VISDIKVKDFQPQLMAAVRAKTTINKITEKVVQLLTETADYLESQGIEPAGPAFGVYYEVGSVVVDVEAGYPVDVEVEGNERVKPGTLPAVKAVTALYDGPHSGIGDAHRAVHNWIHEHESSVNADISPAREIYLTDLRKAGEGEDCHAMSVWPVTIETRADRRRQEKARS